ncbi:MAG: GNAT family N-acetyltransferase [Alteraurantiacibacter sp.]
MSDFRHETERLVLRDWLAEDWTRFWAVTNTSSVMRWLGGVADPEARDFARERLEGYASSFGHTLWALERKDDGGHLSGELLGFCGLKRANIEGTPVFDMPEIGWRLREDAWGHGYAREAAAATLNLAFGRFGYDEAIALTVDGNAPSRGLMKRLGMRRREEFDYHDDRFGPDLNPTIVYWISVKDWEKVG